MPIRGVYIFVESREAVRQDIEGDTNLLHVSYSHVFVTKLQNFDIE